MIIILFGQPHSGKTTLAKNYQTEIFLEFGLTMPIVDGDDIREMFANKDYSKEGRIKNLQRISDIATFLNKQYTVTLVSAVFPLEEARKYLNDLNPEQTIWVYLTYEEERGREANHVKDFEIPNEFEMPNLLTLNTTTNGIYESVQKIRAFHRAISDAAQRSQIFI
jgi:adenylylsulfate kinase-like enzyme